MVEGHRGSSGDVANMQLLDWEFRYGVGLNGQRKQFLGASDLSVAGRFDLRRFGAHKNLEMDQGR